MAVLQRARLVESTRIGHWTYYRRNDCRIADLPELLRGTL
jgi:ArsR family transcriptional regulator